MERTITPQLLEETVLQMSPRFPKMEDVADQLSISMDQLYELRGTNMTIVDIGDDRLIHGDFLELVAERTSIIINAYHEEYPGEVGIPVEQLVSQIITDLEIKAPPAREVLTELLHIMRKLEITQDGYAHKAGFVPKP